MKDTNEQMKSANELADMLYSVIQQHFAGSKDESDTVVLVAALHTALLAIEQQGHERLREKVIKVLQSMR